MKRLLICAVVLICLGCSKEETYRDTLGNAVGITPIDTTDSGNEADIRDDLAKLSFDMECTFFHYRFGNIDSYIGPATYYGAKLVKVNGEPFAMNLRFLFRSDVDIYAYNGTVRKVYVNEIIGKPYFTMPYEYVGGWAAIIEGNGLVDTKDRKIRITYRIEPPEAGYDSTRCECR